MKKKQQLEQSWKDWYDENAKEAAQNDYGDCQVLGMISAIVRPDYDCPDTKRIAHIRYLLDAFDAAKHA